MSAAKKAAAAAYRPEWNRRKALRPTPAKFVHVSIWYEWYVPDGAPKSMGYYRAVGKPRTYSYKHLVREQISTHNDLQETY